MSGLDLPIPHHEDVLHSWKDISRYTGRSIRTIQRWERSFAFPVHRSSGELKGSVMAFRTEIDFWLHHRERGRQEEKTQVHSGLHEGMQKLDVNTKVLRERVIVFRASAKLLGEALDRTSVLRQRLSACRVS